ncbi:MAG: recombinase family protein [Pseudolabrys sp.]|nr:recombinase family protein [Pseudolabrys sp.]
MKNRAPVKAVRCAIYTRVSTDQGLEQDFNSLDAQYEASQAYIRSQAHAGWTLVRTKYDDGGFSGGNTERPALQRLLQDIQAGRIDIIVVYKVDRLTRSLADFAKLVELFDAHGVSFVSVTQQFNTTTSMGRLTLNVLLSFAQFEREVTSERIRDKIAASKRKGLWVGGPLPLGYRIQDGKVAIVPDEAETVRQIFARYLELGSVSALMRDLRQRDVRTKVRPLRTGRTRGGVHFGRGALFYLLRNRFYIGEVNYKGEILPGEQPPILDRELFEAVQNKLTDQWTHHTRTRSRSNYLLSGLLYDDTGHRMAATHATKAGIRYRYYVSLPLVHGQSDATVGTISRVPAANVEKAVVNGLRTCDANSGLPAAAARRDRHALEESIARIEVHPRQLIVRFKDKARPGEEPNEPRSLMIPWQKPPSRARRDIMVPGGTTREQIRPAKIEHRARLVAAIARARCWLDELIHGQVTNISQLAVRHECSERQVNLTLSLAFLAPDLIKAAVEGRLPRGIGVERLRDAPLEWTRQFETLGLSQD